MTLGRNDAALSPSFVEGITLEGPIGHTGNVIHDSEPWRILSALALHFSFKFPLIAARKIAYLIRLPTDEHRLKVGVSWFTKYAIDSVAVLQSTLTKVLSGT